MKAFIVGLPTNVLLLEDGTWRDFVRQRSLACAFINKLQRPFLFDEETNGALLVKWAMPMVVLRTEYICVP